MLVSTPRGQLWLLLLSVFLLSTVHSRPLFASPPPEFEGSSVADHDGVFRHDSGHSRKRGVVSSNFLRYEAVLIDGIVRLDDDVSIENLYCYETVLGSAISVLKNTDLANSEPWTNQTVLVGGSEWNCTQNSKGIPVPFSARVRSLLPQPANTYLVEFVPMTDLFEHLDLELRVEEMFATPVSQEEQPTSSYARRNVIPLSDPEPTPLSDPKSTRKRATDPVVLSPLGGDFFMANETLTVKWVNIPGTLINLIFYTSSVTTVKTFSDISVSAGSFSVMIDDTWDVSKSYQIELEYSCSWFSCSETYSEQFAVRVYPDVTFSVPERGAIYQAGDQLQIAGRINTDYIGTFYLYVYIQEDYASDPYPFVTSFTSKNFSISVPVPSVPSGLWTASNRYYVEIDWDCWAYESWCNYQTSDLFSIVTSGATNSLQFELPYKGSAFQSGTQIQASLIGSFSSSTSVNVKLMQRRVGWDVQMYSNTWVYPTNASQLQFSVTVLPEWTPSRQYYIIAQWECIDDDCLGYAESEEFAVNFVPHVTLSALKKEYQDLETLRLNWNALVQYTDMSISLCTDIPGPDWLGCINLGSSLSTLQKYFEWVVNINVGSAYWDNYFSVTFHCDYGFFCESVESTHFRIRGESNLLDWNWDEIDRKPETSEVIWYHADCDTLKQEGSYCSSPENVNSSVCQLCDMEGFSSSFDLKCKDCYAKIGVTINDLKLSISWFTVEEFSANLTINAISNLTIMADFNMEYQTDYDTYLGTKEEIYAYPSVTIAGFSLSLGVYGTLALNAEWGIQGNLHAEVTATAGAVYDVTFNSSTQDFSTYSRGPYFGVSNFDMYLQATTWMKVGIVPQIQLDILTEEEVLFINAEPYVKLSLSGRAPPFAALAAGTVPQNDAWIQIHADTCWVSHWLEFGVGGGVDWEGGSKWFEDNTLVFDGTLIEEFPIASGCFWPAQNTQGSEPIPIRFSPSVLDFFSITNSSFRSAVMVDVAESLGIPVWAIAKADFYLNELGDTILDVYFSDTDEYSADGLSALLDVLVSNPSSALYSPSRFVSKAAIPPPPSPSSSPSNSPSPTPSLSPSASPSASPSSSPTPSSSVSTTPSASKTPSVSPSITMSASPSASSTPSLSKTPTSSITPTPSLTPTPSVIPAPSKSAAPPPAPTASPSGTVVPSSSTSVTPSGFVSPTASSPASVSTSPSPTKLPSITPTSSTSPSSTVPTASITSIPSGSSSPSSSVPASISNVPSPSSSSSVSPVTLIPSTTPTTSLAVSPTSSVATSPSVTPTVPIIPSMTSVPSPSQGPENSTSKKGSSYVLIGSVAGAAVVVIGAVVAGILILMKKKKKPTKFAYEL